MRTSVVIGAKNFRFF